MKQLPLIKSDEKAYGGSLMTTRKGRGARPLATKHSMHLVLRSSKATGKLSFLRHKARVWGIVDKFAKKYGVRILTRANAGNHLHIHIQLSNRHTYRAFIRAVTSAIAMAVTGASRWNKIKERFWDRRPFTRIVIGRRAFLTLRDYIRINQIESQGHSRDYSRIVIEEFRRSSA